MSRRLHWKGGYPAFELAPLWAEYATACGSMAEPALAEHGHDVTCKSCRRTVEWRSARAQATELHREIDRVLNRTDFREERNVERVRNLVIGSVVRLTGDLSADQAAALAASPQVGLQLVALDRWMLAPRATLADGERALSALLDVLAPVHPGWRHGIRHG